MKNFFIRGITAVELLVVIAVLGIIFAVALPQFSKIRENQVLKNGVVDVLSSVDKARSQTLASLDSSQYGVHFQSDKVIIFKGTAFVEGAGSNETINIITPATISAINLVGGGDDVVFNRLNGAPSVTGSIIVSSTNFTKTITISATGVASVD